MALLFPRGWSGAVFTGEIPERGDIEDPENHSDTIEDENSVLVGGFGEGEGGNADVEEGDECPYREGEDEYIVEHLGRGVPWVLSGYVCQRVASITVSNTRLTVYHQGHGNKRKHRLGPTDS